MRRFRLPTPAIESKFQRRRAIPGMVTFVTVGRRRASSRPGGHVAASSLPAPATRTSAYAARTSGRWRTRSVRVDAHGSAHFRRPNRPRRQDQLHAVSSPSGAPRTRTNPTDVLVECSRRLSPVRRRATIRGWERQHGQGDLRQPTGSPHRLNLSARMLHRSPGAPRWGPRASALGPLSCFAAGWRTHSVPVAIISL
jgi:hypothetical protein